LGKTLNSNRLFLSSPENEVSAASTDEKVKNHDLKILFLYENKVQEITYPTRNTPNKDIKNFSVNYSFSIKLEKAIYRQEFGLEKCILPFYLLHKSFLV